MTLTEKEEAIAKAEIALKIARDRRHKINVLMNEEMKVQHKPVTDAILLSHKTEFDEITKEVADAEEALKNELA